MLARIVTDIKNYIARDDYNHFIRQSLKKDIRFHKKQIKHHEAQKGSLGTSMGVQTDDARKWYETVHIRPYKKNLSRLEKALKEYK